MSTSFDRGKTLQELEQEDWGEPDYPSALVQTCHRLRRVPVADFTVEDLRILIGQKIGLQFLVPVALEKLQEEPQLEASQYPGDLLNAVQEVPEPFWSMNTDLRELLVRLEGGERSSSLSR